MTGIEISLKKILSKQYKALLQATLDASQAECAIEDAEGNLLMGSSSSTDKYLIQLNDETLGWVRGDGLAKVIAEWLNYRSQIELENRKLGLEVLDKYKEINLFSRLSEKFSSSLELSSILQGTIEEVQKLVDASSAAVMLMNETKDTLLVASAFGTSMTLNEIIPVANGKGIITAILATGKGEIVNNTAVDPRFSHRENKDYAVICVPIKSGGDIIGVLFVSNTEKVDYMAGDLQLMLILASQTGNAIATALLHKAELKSAVARSEIEKGRQMQKNFLPPNLLEAPGWDFATKFMPAREVAGDFYDNFELPHGCVAVVIADVCDKGVGSALFMALFRSLLRIFASQCVSRASLVNAGSQDVLLVGDHSANNPTTMVQFSALEAVSLTNDYVGYTHGDLVMFATTFFGVLDPATGLLAYINGGHESLILMDASGVKGRIKSTGPAVGMMPGAKFKVGQIILEPGDMLIGYTDGVPEARNPNREFFTEAKLLDLLQSHFTEPEPLLDKVEASLLEHIGEADQFDDITLLAVYRQPVI